MNGATFGFMQSKVKEFMVRACEDSHQSPFGFEVISITVTIGYKAQTWLNGGVSMC